MHLRRFVTMISQFFAEMSGWFLTIITFLLILNLLTRFFGIGIDGLLELTTFVFLAVVYLGLAHCEENDEHIKVNVILSKVPEPLRKILHIFNYVLAIGIGGILTYAAFDAAVKAYISKDSLPGTTPLPTFPAKLIIFLGLAFFFLQAILRLYNSARNKKW
jgi:TRAP-type C4-dicarboxylate transport system permease small subunit